MGMRDESWCNGCGTGIVYTPDDEAYCGNCAYEYGRVEDNRLNKVIEYMKLHLISLEQDQESLVEKMDAIDPNSKEFNYLDIEFNWNNGQITATSHLLNAAKEML